MPPERGAVELGIFAKECPEQSETHPVSRPETSSPARTTS